MKLPPDWTKSLLHHLAYVQTGISKSENRKGPSVKRPYLRVANVQDGYIDLSEMKEISVPIGQVERFTLQKDDLVLTEGGDFDKLGRGCIWNGEIPDCVHQNHIFAVRILDKKVLVPRFLAYQMQSPYGRQYFLSCAKQTTNLASINSSQLKQFPVLFPSSEEQHQITDLLATWDDAIEKAEKLIEAKEKRFSWLLNRLIKKGSVHGEWRRVKLGKVAEINKGQQLNVVDMVDDGKYYVLNGGIEPSGFTDNWNTLEDTITISEGGNSCGFVNFNAPKFWCGGHCYALNNVISEVEKKYLYHFLKAHERSLMSMRVGSGLPNIQKKDLQNFPIKFPLLELQLQIATTLNIARQEIDLLKKQVEAYRRQKSGLMQKLLTGQWRVNIGGEEK